MTASQHTIAGRVLTMPVEIRKATQHMAMFSVDADAAQRMIDYSGLQVCRYLPGRAIVVLTFMHYIDGDLDQYYEFSTSVMVNPPGSTASGPRAVRSAGAFTHHMPVDQAFTLEAGTQDLGLPESDGGLHRSGRPSVRFRLQHRRAIGGRHGIPPRAAGSGCAAPRRRSAATRIATVVACETAFEISRSTACALGSGGVRLRLGDHPYAKDLASLGLPKRAMLSSSAENVQMSFGDAQEIS